MYASIRTYHVGAGTMDGLMHRVAPDLADALSVEPGFVGHQAIATAEDTLVSISIFRTLDEARSTDVLVGQWLREDLADFGVEPTMIASGEVMVSRATGDMLEHTHH